MSEQTYMGRTKSDISEIVRDMGSRLAVIIADKNKVRRRADMKRLHDQATLLERAVLVELMMEFLGDL
jgi:hypothetical protein